MREISRSDILHITIGASAAEGPTLVGDLRLLKAALLYADRAKLCSFTSSMMLVLIKVNNLSLNEQLDYLHTLFPLLSNSEFDTAHAANVMRQFRNILKKKGLSVSQLQGKAQMQSQFMRMFEDVKKVVMGIAQEGGMAGLESALKSGLVEVHQLKPSSDINEMVMQYFDVVSGAVTDGSTFPLFDDQTGELIRSSVEEGIIKVSDISVARGKQIGLAANLLTRLPLFDAATIDEILDIRKELEKPLVRFRSAIIKFSEATKSSSWDAMFPLEAENVLRKEVEPAILEIEEAVQHNSFLRELTRKALDKPFDVAKSSALGIILSQFSHLPALATSALGVGMGGTGLIMDVNKEWKQKREAAEKNQLFFYYRAGKLLSHKHST